MWVWPPVCIAVVAVAGQVFGLLGSAIAAGSAVAVLALVATDLLYTGGSSKRAWVVVGFAVAVTVVMCVLWQGGAEWVRDKVDSDDAVADAPVAEDARGRDFTQEQLKEFRLRGAQLAGADLTGLDLHDLEFDGADAAGASFHGADLRGASLRGADLRGADFSAACLIDVELAGAQLAGADFDAATVDPRISLPAGTTVGTPLPAGERAESCD